MGDDPFHAANAVLPPTRPCILPDFATPMPHMTIIR